MNSAFVEYEVFCRSRRVLTAYEIYRLSNVPYDNMTMECESRNISWRIKWVSIGQGPCAVGGGDDCTWLADGLKTMSVVAPDKKCKHHGIMLLAC